MNTQAVKSAINSPLRLERSPAVEVGEVGNKHTIQNSNRFN